MAPRASPNGSRARYNFVRNFHKSGYRECIGRIRAKAESGVARSPMFYNHPITFLDLGISQCECLLMLSVGQAVWAYSDHRSVGSCTVGKAKGDLTLLVSYP
jgi:hypothetical protein